MTDNGARSIPPAPTRDPMPAIPGIGPRAGIGLRAQHHLRVLSDAPAGAWFEAHTENYFAGGGAHVEALARIRANYPLSLHRVGLSLGSAGPLGVAHLGPRPRAGNRFPPAPF